MDFKNPAGALGVETGTQLFPLLESRPSLAALEERLLDSLGPGDVIEISGDAGSGKTELLYHFIVRCILPPSWRGYHLGGLNAGCVFVDNDYHFNLFRVISLLEKKIFLSQAETGCNVSNAEVSAFVTDCLRLLYVVKCSSSQQFMVTLYSLENMLSSKMNVSCMMIDSISAFYWADRMNLVHQPKKLDESHAALVSMLGKLVNNYSLVLLASKQNLMKRNEPCAGEEPDFMGRHWQKFVTHRVEVSIDRVQSGQTILTLVHLFKDRRDVKKCAVTSSGLQFL